MGRDASGMRRHAINMAAVMARRNNPLQKATKE